MHHKDLIPSKCRKKMKQCICVPTECYLIIEVCPKTYLSKYQHGYAGHTYSAKILLEMVSFFVVVLCPVLFAVPSLSAKSAM